MKLGGNVSTKARRGFTIVELIVVIVVISILVTITVIAYNNVKTQAENSKTTQAVTQIVKALTNYGVRNGNYPITSVYPCIGSTPSCALVAGSTNCWGIGAASNSPAFNTTLQAAISSVPEPSSQQMNCGGNTYQGAFYSKNDTTNGKTATINYFLRGNQTCSIKIGTVATYQQDDTTRCSVTFPTLP